MNRKKKLFYGWIIMIVLCFDYVIMLCGTLYTFGSILKPMAAELGMTATQASAGQTLLALCSALVVVIIGHALVKIQPKTVLILGCICGMIGCGSMAFVVTGAGGFYLCFAVFFSVMNVCGSNVGSQLLVSRWFSRRRSTTLAILMSMGGVGGILFPQITTRLLLATGTWRSIWVVVFIGCAVAMTLTLKFIRNSPQEMGLLPDGDEPDLQDAAGGDVTEKGPAPSEKAGPAARRQLFGGVYRTPVSFTQKQALRTPYFYVSILSQICVTMTTSAMAGYIIAFLTDRGIDATDAASALSLYALFNLFGRLSIGFVLDRIDVKHVLKICILGGGVCLFLLSFVHTGSQALMFAAGFGLFVSCSVMCPMTNLMNTYGLEHYSEIGSVQYMISSLSNSVIMLLAGVIHDFTGSYLLFFLALGTVEVICFLLQFLVKRPMPPAAE